MARTTVVGRAMLTGVVLALSVGVVRAQQSPSPTEMSLEELMQAEVRTVFGASRFLQKVSEAPASVTIVTKDEIERFGYRTFAEILRSVTGLYVTYDRNYSYLGMRGVSRPGDYNTRYLVLIDGHRLNDNVYDLALIGTEFPIDVALIDHLEVIRGPSSSLYGTSAFFGIVNVVTRSPADLAGLTGEIEAGSLNTQRGRASFGRSFNGGGGALVSGSAYRSDGGLDGQGRPDQDAFRNVFSSVSRADWTVRLVHSTRDKGIPTGAFGIVATDPRNETTDARSYIDAAFEGTLRGVLLQWRTGVDRYAYDGTYIYEGETAPTFFVDGSRGTWWSTDVVVGRRLGRHRLTAGAEYRANLQQDQFWTFFGENGEEEDAMDDRRSSQIGAVFAQDEIRLARRLVANLGVRHDWYPGFGHTTNPRLALIYEPHPRSAIKLLYGTAFRAPNTYELHYYSDSRPEDLRPETAQTAEIVWEYAIGPRFRSSASIFATEVWDIITQVTAAENLDGLAFANVHGLQTKGFSLEAGGAEISGLRWGAAYTHARAQDHSTRAWLSNAPRHLGLAQVTGPVVGDRIFAAAQVNYMSDRRTLQDTVLPRVWLASLTLSAPRVTSRAGLFLDFDNLFGASYSDPGAEEHPAPAIPQDGRTFRLRLSWRF